jgi:hypothetical protein
MGPRYIATGSEHKAMRPTSSHGDVTRDPRGALRDLAQDLPVHPRVFVDAEAHGVTGTAILGQHKTRKHPSLWVDSLMACLALQGFSLTMCEQ